MEIRIPDSGKFAIYWLGQAGFLFVTDKGARIAVDPYFSSTLMERHPDVGQGFKRLTPPPCRASELRPDALIISHEHDDHLDMDSMSDIYAPGLTRAFVNKPSAAILRDAGYKSTALSVGDKFALPGCEVDVLDCDHGPETPDALGFIFNFSGTKVYYSGDTALSPALLAEAIAARPDVAILPINGAFGNLNGVEAAELAGLLHCKLVIPCHFWTFARHLGDPQSLLEALPEKAPGCRAHLMAHGEELILGKM